MKEKECSRNIRKTGYGPPGVLVIDLNLLECCQIWLEATSVGLLSPKWGRLPGVQDANIHGDQRYFIPTQVCAKMGARW